MTDLKTVLVDALNASLPDDEFGLKFVTEADNAREFHVYKDHQIGVQCDDCYYDTTLDLDRLAKAVTDHVLDREKVRAALIVAMASVTDDGDFDTEVLVDRLIEGLAGKAST